ncbi:MAG: helix-turn-helix domain-containing protein [Nanoarchaeota archaeon]
MEKKDEIILLFRVGMDRKAIAEHENVSRGYINKVIREYKKEKGTIKYYSDRFTFNETFKLFVYSLLVALLLGGFTIYQNIATTSEISELKSQNKNYSLKIIDITSAIEQSLRLDDINEMRRILNETIKEKEIYKGILQEFSDDFYKRAKLAYEKEDFRQAVYFYELIIDSNSDILNNQEFWFEYGISLMNTRNLGGAWILIIKPYQLLINV